MAHARLEKAGDSWTVIEGGRYLYSKYNPVRLSQRIAGSAPVREQCIYFVPSPLLGYGIDVLLQRIPENSIILAIEQSEQMMAVCSSKIARELLGNKRITWVRLSNCVSLHKVLRELNGYSFRRVERVNLNGGSLLPDSIYDELENFIINDVALYWKNRLVIRQLGRLWIRHVYANLGYLANGESEFHSLSELEFHGALTLIAGAGPSLEAALPLISNHRDNIFLLATDTALPLLCHAKLQPDAVLALDTQFWNYLDFHDSRGNAIPVIADISTYPHILTATGGPCYLFSSTFSSGLEFFRRLEEAGLREDRLDPLGSVGITAVEIAIQYSASPVVLTGVDFAYEKGKSHARGSSAHIWQLIRNRRLVPCPGLEEVMKRPGAVGRMASGDFIQSDEVLLDYASRFVRRYGQKDGIFVLEPGGVNLCVPVISVSDFRMLLVKSRNNDRKEVYKSLPGRDQPKNQAEIARQFIYSEMRRLDSILKAWDAYSMDREAEGLLVEALKGMEHVYYDFPDYHRTQEKDSTFLFRVANRTRYYERFLKRMMGQELEGALVRSTARKAL